MKKSLLSMFAVAAGLLMATSCSTKQEDVKTDGEATVTFVAQVPSSVNSRAPQAQNDASYFGDGTNATNLTYAVYKVDADGNWAVIDELCDNTTINISTTVSLKLVNGNTYAVAFWADAPKSIYSFEKETFTITADYSEATTSNESYDAFYAIKEFVVNGSSQETVELKRPFAQLNIGTADLDAAKKAGYTVNAAGVKVTVANTLNLKDGKVSGEDVITFGQTTLPNGKTFPVADYSYLTMNYLLVSEDKTSDNTVTISYDNEEVPERTFNNVPLQRNYRTNIYGNLLTSTTEFNVIIKPAFAEPDYAVEAWDGTTKTQPQEDANGAYLVTKAAEWAWLGEQKSINKNVILDADIDFGGNSVKTIKLAQFSPSMPSLTFDGQNHTLSNVITLAAEYPAPGDGNNSGGHYANALFTVGQWATAAFIKNLKVKNIHVDCPHSDNAGNYCGYAAAICAAIPAANDGLVIENVHVDGATVKGVQSVGAIIGNASGKFPIKVTGCTVANTALSNYEVKGESGFVATIIGRVRGTNVTIENCKVLTGNTIDAWYADKESRGEASINAVAAVDTKNKGVLNIDTETTATGTEENVTVSKHKIE